MRSLALAIVAAGLLANTSPSSAQADASLKSSLEKNADIFLDWQRGRGEAKALEDLRAAVTQTPLVLNVAAEDEMALKMRVSDALFSAGIRRSDLRGSRGTDLAQNMADAMAGRATTEQLASLAQLVVIATVGERVDEGADLGDGYLGSITLGNLNVLKGQARGNDALIIRLLSGTENSGERRAVSFEDSIEPGKSYLFFLSRDYYKTNASRPGRQVRGSDLATNSQAFVSQIFLPLEVIDEQVAGASGDQAPKQSVSAVSQRIAASK